MRRVLLALLLLSLTPSTALARECTVTGPEARAEATLRGEIRARTAYGFRDDRAYVARLIAAGPPSRRYGIRVTKAEDRYLDRRWKLGVGAKVGRYLRRRPAINAFWDVRDDWPRGPYMAVFIADDPAKHRAAILRRASYPRSTRIVRVRYSYAAKDRLQRRIEDDRERLDRLGFEVIETDTDWGLDRIDVEVVTRRTDAKAFFARRYGSVVRARAHPRPTYEGCTRASSFEIAPDGRSLTVSWTDAPSKPARIELTERGDRVAIGIVSRFSRYPGFGDPGGKAVVRLSAPLAGRPVYDASSGARLLQVGPAPGQPPCPVHPKITPLESLTQQRARYGMNTDPAFVQSLLDADREYTPEEQAWVTALQEAEYDDGVHDYLHSGRVYRDWGGTTLVTRYPEPPSLLIRFVRRVAFHEREIRKLAKLPVQVVRSTVPRDWFYALPQHIEDDARLADGYIDDVFVVHADGDESAQVVNVHVIATRPDAEAFLKARYGGILRVHVIGDRVECRGAYPTR